MKLHNGNLIVLRCANPVPKSWPGPWFQFGNPGNITGKASFATLASYIGKDATRAVFKHFKCLKGRAVRLTLNGYVAKSLGVKHGTRWNFSA